MIRMLLPLLLAATGFLLSGCSGNVKPDHEEARHRIVLEALGQVGRPYRYGGATPDGFDCSGLVQYVFAQAGIKVPRTARAQHALGDTIKLSKAEPGDLLFYSFAGRKVDHVAIYLGDDQAVHAPASGRSVIVASVHLPYWQKHFVDAVRVFD
jgi:murein DD-endopeptidase